MVRRPPRIITLFAKKLGEIIADYLSDPELLQQRIPLKDRLAVKLMLSLNKRFYRRELLFRDYSQKPSDLFIDYVMPNGHIEKLHIESIDYTEEILSKRLTIVSKQKSLPTNLHMLLLMLCRYSQEPSWYRTRIKRRKIMPTVHDLFFQKTAKVLRRQYMQLKHVSAVSETYRKKYGAFHFILGQNSEELVEEISLFDLMEIIPIPLRIEIQQQSTWYIPLIERIISSLNESYGLLRSCGLPPHEWRGQLSIGKLRDLKQLKRVADNYLKKGEKKEIILAYQQAFFTLQTETKKQKIAGFNYFMEFSHSKVGVKLLKMESNFSDNNEDEQYSLLDTLSAPESRSHEMDDALKVLLRDYADDFSPLVAYFFEQILILQRSIYNEKGIFNDLQFRRLIVEDHAYTGLDDEKLIDKLIQKTKTIMQKHIDLDACLH